jgi:hypothetical protein
MTEQNQNKSRLRRVKQKIFTENPYDLEMFFEGLYIAAEDNKELQFIDKFICQLRNESNKQTSQIIFDVLCKDLKITKFETDKEV